MMSDTSSPNQRTDQLIGSEATTGSYVDWPAIFAGAMFALALSFLLISFGAGLGLSLSSPYSDEGVSAVWLGIATGIWLVWVMVTSFGAGGYLTGRMRRRAEDAKGSEIEARDGTHGLVVWATGALVSTVVVLMGVGGVVGVGVSTVGTASEVVAEAADSDYFANVMLRGTDMSDDGVDQDVQQQVAAVLVRSAARGEMLDRDRSYLAQVVASNTGLDQDEARSRVDGVTAEIDAARETALDAVDRARVAGVVFGFIAAATLLMGAIAAFFAAAAGGRHRDEGLGFDVFPAGRR